MSRGISSGLKIYNIYHVYGVRDMLQQDKYSDQWTAWRRIYSETVANHFKIRALFGKAWIARLATRDIFARLS